MKKILFTGGGGAGSEALLRLLGDHYEVHFADADLDAVPYPVPQSRWHLIPFASDPRFIEGVSRLCQDLEVDILIPAVDEELLPISQARERMGCDVLLPPTDFIQVHLDKLLSSERMNSHGLPVPHTELLIERQDVSFPCIVKPRQGRGSRGVAIVHSEQELQAHVMLCKDQFDDFVVQELLQGQEYTVMMAADKNACLRAVVPVKVGIKKGITLRAATHNDVDVIAACSAIHRDYPVPGCYNIQLIKTESGISLPFEINPRISTTACLAVAAGVDFVDIYLGSNEEKGNSDRGLQGFNDSLSLNRSWYNNFSEMKGC